MLPVVRPYSSSQACVHALMRVAILSILCAATAWGQLANPVPSPSGAFIVLNVGQGNDRQFEIQDTKAGYRTVLSAAQLQFRSEPVSKAAIDAVWSPDGTSVAIEIALNKSTAITCVYSQQGETFSPVQLDAFQADHKVVPLGWLGPRDLILSIDGPYPSTADHPARGRLCTFRFRPGKSQFEKIYESSPSRLKPAKLLLAFDSADGPDIRKLREKHGRDQTYFRRRDTAVLLSGPAAEDAIASLLAAEYVPGPSFTPGVYGLGILLYLDEHDRARFLINTTDAPGALISRTKSNTTLVWTVSDLLPPRPDELYRFERYIAPAFYRTLLPQLRRVRPGEIERLSDFLQHYFKRSLEDLLWEKTPSP